MTEQRNSKLAVVVYVVLIGALLGVGLGRLGPMVLGAILPLCGLGLLAAVAVHGPAGARAGIRFLFFRGRIAELPHAARALGTAGVFLIHLGVAGSFVALLSNLDTYRLVLDSIRNGTEYPQAGPADIARIFQYGILLGVPATLCAGRFILGAAAELAASRAGVTPPVYSFGVQFAAFLVVPIHLSLLVITYPPISH